MRRWCRGPPKTDEVPSGTTEGHVLEDDLPEYRSVAETLDSVEDLDACETSVRVVVGSDALGQV
jgi:hypothetical protein